ncbi:MAG: hypothetical protein OSA02_03795 [Schleiferiaceae bacterium]|jgi:hypothetical protein|nr:hypothetical protein [Schleiferiaceae bacterium]
MNLLKIFFATVLFFTLSGCADDVVPHGETSFLPMNASVVIKVNDLQKVTQFNDSTQLPFSGELPISELFNLYEGTWIGALVSSGADKMDWVWTASTKRDSMPGPAVEQGTVHLMDSNYVIVMGQAMAVSKSEGVLKDIINQRKSGFNLMQNKGFKRLWDNASSADALNIFIQHDEIESVGNLYYNEDWEWLSKFAAWSEIDIAFRKDGLMVTSVALAPDSSTTFLSIFNQKAKSAKVSSIIAGSSSYAVKMDVGNPIEWVRDFNVYRGKTQRLKKAISILENAGLETVETASWFDGSFVRIGYGESTVIAAKLKNSDAVEKALNRVSDTQSLFHGHARGTFKNEHRFTLNALFGWFFSDLGSPSWIIQNDWLFLSGEAQTLEVYTGELDLKKSWGSTSGLSSLADGIDKKGHFAIAFQANSSAASTYLNWDDSGSNWSKSIITGVLDVKNDLAFGNLTSLTMQEEDSDVSTYLWSTALTGEVTIGPWLVKNHRSGAKNIVVQDETHKLYWLNENGEILWEKPLKNDIVGDITQIDLFKNNKFQLLFSTSSQLHCIDLLGRDVDGYPIALKGKNTLGVTVVDYDKNRNYRFLVPIGQDLYNYTSDGKLVKGWKTDAASATLTQVPFLFQKEGKDYVITSTDEQAIVLNRRGEVRIKTTTLTASPSPWNIMDGAIPSVIRVDSEGELQTQYWDGTTSSKLDPLEDVMGLSSQVYGLVVWNNDQIVVRSNAGSTETEVEDILTLDCYSGGTGIAFTLDRVEVFNLKTGEAYGQFRGSAAKAGRFTSSGAPVVVINQGNTVVCYQL